MDLIKEFSRHNILGRSGSGFPTAAKWQAVKNQKSDKKYVICNGSEGEPGCRKDEYILKKYPEAVVDGIKCALAFIGKDSEGFIYLKKKYYWRYVWNLKSLCKGFPISVFKERGGYLAGEETCACESIEGKMPFPRQRPPFVCEKGLWGKPTLVNNVETFYCAGKISKGEYRNEGFYAISGKARKRGVFQLPQNLAIKEILEKTGNYPKFDFFVQAGGGASGEILLPKELDKQIEGVGSIVIFNRKKTNPIKLMQKWTKFFLKENCDKCVPCREGMIRVYEMAKSGKMDKKLLTDILFSMEETSFCPLGKSAPRPFKTLLEKIVK